MTEIGLARTSVRHRARQGGPWRRVLPATYHLSVAPLTASQRMQAALLYAGTPSALTGIAALQLGAVDAAGRFGADEVHVLIPERSRRVSTGFVTVERTKNWPEVSVTNGLAVVPLARAAIDASRHMDRANDVRAVLSELVRSGAASTAQLDHELRIGQRRRTALAREAIAILTRGPVSVAEIDLYERWVSSGLPDALWNVDLLTPDGGFLARPDVYLPDAGVVFEVDSLAFHYEREQWESTMERHSRMTAHGLLVLHATPRRIRTRWPDVRSEVVGAIRSREGQPRPRLGIRT